MNHFLTIDIINWRYSCGFSRSNEKRIMQ